MKLLGTITMAGSLVILSACQAGGKVPGLPGINTAFNPNYVSFEDTDFELKTCEITPDRTAVCKLVVTNRFRDKGIDVSPLTVQDNNGTDYQVTGGGFGEPSNRPQWRQIALADSTYNLSVIATNLSSKATSIRAIVFSRLLVRSTQGQTLGYRDKVLFSKPTMVTSGQDQPASQTTATAQPAATQPATTQTAAASATPEQWQIVGYWDYDAADGQSLSQGLVWKDAPGANLGMNWQAHLELKNHAQLPPRARSLWPVMINAKQRKVCANYPGYPTYSAFIDMPGSENDGIYQLAKCAGG